MVAKTEFYCPVCGRDQEYLSIWRERGSDRIRIFCEDCSRTPEYKSLEKENRILLNKDGFERFAAARLLRHVFEKEQSRQSDSAPLLVIDINLLTTCHYQRETVSAADRDGNVVSHTGIPSAIYYAIAPCRQMLSRSLSLVPTDTPKNSHYQK